MTNDVVIAFLGILGAAVAAFASGIWFIIRTSKDAGRREAKLDAAIDKLVKIELALVMVSEHAVKIGQLESQYTGLRSDFKHLLRGSGRWEEGHD